jgi:uncharacterized protein
MTLKEKLNADLKTALLSGEKERAEILRTLKGAILNAEIESGAREAGLDDAAMISLMAKESKKRLEAADMYAKAGAQDKADRELREKAIIEAYLPEQASEADVLAVIQKHADAAGGVTQQTMGRIIGATNQELKPR